MFRLSALETTSDVPPSLDPHGPPLLGAAPLAGARTNVDSPAMTSWEKIAVIDTENGSADLYSHLGGYSVITLAEAERAGMAL